MFHLPIFMNNQRQRSSTNTKNPITHHARSEVDQLHARLDGRQTGDDDHKDGDEVEDDEHDHARRKCGELCCAHIVVFEHVKGKHRVRFKPPAQPLPSVPSFFSLRDVFLRRTIAELFALKDVLPQYRGDDEQSTNDETCDDLCLIPYLIRAPVEAEQK